jgi:hypothetical protein
MGNTKAKRHTHKYEKVILNGDKIWRCARSNCGHYMPKHQEILVTGKDTECWGCGITMELNAQNMHMDKPQCYDCQNGVVSQLENISKRISVPAGFNIEEFAKDLITDKKDKEH